MSTFKTALKAAKGALDAHQYDAAIGNATKVLQEDSKNYHANVFLGLAFEKQGRNEESEKAYRAAASLKASDPLAWQGLISLYEQQGGRKLSEYHDAATHLATLLMEMYVVVQEEIWQDDKTRCQTVVDKYIDFSRKYGSRTQYRHSLDILLPDGDLYNYLEGRVMHPSITYSRISDIVEQEEKEKINFEIGQRRTRLGAKIDQVTAEVKKEVLQASDLETLYQRVIDYTDDDAVRRSYEEKLLQHAYDTLIVLPTAQKGKKLSEVTGLAKGLVILKHPFQLAWEIALEWEEVERLEELDLGLLEEYVEFFPEDGLGKILRGFLESEIAVFPKHVPIAEQGDSGKEKAPSMTPEDRLVLMTDGIEDAPTSILGLRIMAEYYLYLEEFESVVDTARSAMRHVVMEARTTSLSLVDNVDAIKLILGTALVRYQAPRHHPEARTLFEDVLARKPVNTYALIGIGLIFEEQEEYDKAIDFLNRAIKHDPNVRVESEAAWCRALSGDHATGFSELENCLPQVTASDPRTKSLKAQILYRTGICLWNMDDSKSARRDRNKAYARFIASLQADINCAPAYTSLGIYYADYAKDKSRARKCFQKAFELAPSEVVAAERLAQSFAKTSEWDLVEVVAQRVVDSGRLRPSPGSKKNGISWPFAALGVVQLNNQDYSKSVVSFQSALRISPKDYYGWVGLGESYHSSGRYIAATKALERAQKLEQELQPEALGDTWFSAYMLANVKRELGEYEMALTGYNKVLASRKTEYGVSISLLQTLIEAAWQNTELGFFGRAIESGRQALETAEDLATWCQNAYNLWKSVGDLCSVYTYAQSYADNFPVEGIQNLLRSDTDTDAYDVLADVDGIDWAACERSTDSKNPGKYLEACCYAAILAQKRAIACCAHDPHAQSIAWYNLGWIEHRAWICCHGQEDREKAKISSFLKAAVQCFKRAIELESGNADFWNSLGVVTSQLSPQVAQHAFIRSLFLNDKNARVWTNLGVFYLIHSDIQLANDAFARAQSADPDHSQAWLCQGLLAARLGETREARNLFTHAFEISNASATEIRRSFAASILDHLLSSQTGSKPTANLLQPLLALRQLKNQTLIDLPNEHTLSLLIERTGGHTEASQRLSSISSALEAEYEDSESSETLARFAQAKADLSRSQLAEHDYSSAAESAETALDLASDDDQESSTRRKIRLSAHLSAGLSYFHLGSLDRSIEMFRAVLKETHGDPEIVCLTSQILWAKGGKQERSIAREQLFDCIEKHPGHVGTTLLLGAIAVLDDDQDTIEAVSEDLQGLQIRDNLSPQQYKQLAQLLNAIAFLYPGDKGSALSQSSKATAAVMLQPSQPSGWSQLADLTDDSHPAEMAVLTTVRKVPPSGELSAENLSAAHAGTRKGVDAQISIMLAPWITMGWQALSQAV
ncbi:MAG: hypothetical protein Q9220_004463 [cf. Caloplaca sp. 1 TL-2023]